MKMKNKDKDNNTNKKTTKKKNILATVIIIIVAIAISLGILLAFVLNRLSTRHVRSVYVYYDRADGVAGCDPMSYGKRAFFKG